MTPKEVLESLARDGLVSSEEIKALTELSDRQVSLDENSKTCPRCGSKVIFNSKYCFNCGSKFTMTSGELEVLSYIHNHYPRIECDHCNASAKGMCSYGTRCLGDTNPNIILPCQAHRYSIYDKIAILSFIRSNLDQFPDLKQILEDERIRLWK